MKLRHLLFSTAALLTSAQSPAGTTDRAGPCVHFHSFYECVHYPTGECFWDYDDNRCESRWDRGETPGGGNCVFKSYYSCINDPRCFWDNNDNRCEHR